MLTEVGKGVFKKKNYILVLTARISDSLSVPTSSTFLELSGIVITLETAY